MCIKSKFRTILLAISTLAITIGCADPEGTNRPTPDVTPEQVDIIRFDQLLCLPSQSPDSPTPEDLMNTYPIFSDVFFNQIIYPQNTSSIALEELVANFCSAPAIQHLLDTTQVVYPDLEEVEQELGEAFGYYHYYFPDRSIPEVYTYVSEFGIGTFTVDDRVLGIGLDFFLGKNYPYYDPAVFPNYMVETMTPEYLSVNAIRALTQVLLSPIITGNLLDYMVYNGKSLYLASRFQPSVPMHLLCLYNPPQMEWVQNNEFHIWSFFLDLGYFYENDPRKFKKFVDPAPNTPGLPEIAPGRVANWIGYRIVESYMNRFPEITLEELAAETDFQKIMDQSNYKPPRPR